MNKQHSKGFTLVEALIALLVLSIGLLGVAALQLTALQNNNNAMFRSQATYFAYDIADRMRANRNIALEEGSAYNTEFGAGEVEDCESVVACDVDAWQTMLSKTLPGGEGAVETDAATGEATIRIRWKDSKESTADKLVFVTRTRI